MGLNLSRPTPSQPQPSQGQAPAAPQEEESYQQYDISADRQMMTQTLVNSPEVDALASQIEVYNLESIVSFGAGAADEISKCSDVVLNSMNLSQLDDSSAMLNTLADHVVAVRGNCDSEVDQMVLEFPRPLRQAVRKPPQAAGQNPRQVPHHGR